MLRTRRGRGGRSVISLALTDLAHAKGMLFGLYAAAGAETCRQFPGALNHEALDAATYAKYGADYVKLDACGDAPLGGEFKQCCYLDWNTDG